MKSWSQWLRGLRHELSSLGRTMRLRVCIPLDAWMSVCVYSVFVLLCVYAAALRRADPPSKESYRLCKRSINWKNSPRHNKQLKSHRQINKSGIYKYKNEKQMKPRGLVQRYLYSGGVRFESRPRYWLFWLRFIVLFVSPPQGNFRCSASSRPRLLLSTSFIVQYSLISHNPWQHCKLNRIN
jgi:hypothetical protein